MLIFNPEQLDHEHPYMSDKVAQLMLIKDKLKSAIPIPTSAANIAQVVVKDAHILFSTLNKVITKQLLHCAEMFCIITTNDEVIRAKKMARVVSELSDYILKTSRKELAERIDLVAQQSFDDPFSDGYVPGETAKDALGRWPLNDFNFSNKTPIIPITKCKDSGIVNTAKWIQAMLQLEGADRFSMYREEGQTFVITNREASVIIIGSISYVGADDGPDVIYRVNSIECKLGTDYRSNLSITEIIDYGSTYAASCIRF